MSEKLTAEDLSAPAEIGWWNPEEHTAEQHPYRVVDVHYRGWWGRDDEGRYVPSIYAEQEDGVSRTTYTELDAARGPLKHVIGVSDEDWDTVTSALVAAKAKAIPSVLVALFRLFRGPQIPGNSREAMDARRSSTERRRLAMRAGREGSWEAEGIYRLAWGVGADIADKPRRFDEPTVKLLVDTIERWISGYPRYYIEVAETLNSLVGAAVEQAGGWNALCDAPLRRGARLEQNGAETVRLHFDGFNER